VDERDLARLYYLIRAGTDLRRWAAEPSGRVHFACASLSCAGSPSADCASGCSAS